MFYIYEEIFQVESIGTRSDGVTIYWLNKYVARHSVWDVDYCYYRDVDFKSSGAKYIPRSAGCGCSCIRFGTYENQINATLPFPTNRSTNIVGIDRCIYPEIRWLWFLGIRTIECCCGHNVNHGYIAVNQESVEAMEALGYKRIPFDQSRNNFFYPRSLYCRPAGMPPFDYRGDE